MMTIIDCTTQPEHRVIYGICTTPRPDLVAQAEAAAAAAQEEARKQAEQMAQLPDRVAALETANNDIILMMADLIGGN